MTRRETAQLVPSVLLFALAFPAFRAVVHTGDYPAHISFAISMTRDRPVPPHPLFHASLRALIGRNEYLAWFMTAFLMAMAVAVRAGLTAGVLTERAERPALVGTTVLCLLLAVAMPLPFWWRDFWHGDIPVGQPSGQPAANVWHNPTFVFAMPFVLWSFVASVRLLDVPALRGAVVTGAALVLCLLAKPNYVMAFLPVFGPVLLFSLRRSVRGGRLRAPVAAAVLLLAFAPVLAVLAVQAAWLHGNVPVVVAPLLQWQKLTPNIPGSLLVGLAFPIAVAACFPRRLLGDRNLTLAWATFGVAGVTFALMLERDVNFVWGVHFATAVLFVVSAAFVLRQTGWRRALCLALLALHAASGAAYVARSLDAPLPILRSLPVVGPARSVGDRA
jgi:hypothetical protein